MSTWFISDLHLFPTRPQSIELLLQFLTYLEQQRPQGLYVLGDLFEYWVGDDVLEHPMGAGFVPVIEAFQRLAAQGVPIAFQHGNRDFLLGKHCAEQAGFTLLPEHYVVDLYGVPTLLMHGDSLCTEDRDYQRLRMQLRDPVWQQQFLALPLAQRIEQAQALRAESHTQMQAKAEAILDVTPTTVESVMQSHGVTQLIHGHTHCPAIHPFIVQGQCYQRIVLGDWYGDKGSFLKVSYQTVKLLNDYQSAY
ncbi:UDP-2,3-diacylglucosamine diphosphatase [Thiofilum flexile]|uniref:UDP-2,3-diacylglucosamine diphosphatase n=1 Tax=Thiofilum flexile TaxID=125627 RepID=UPI00037AE9DD|nr:UDP-2,3-diacylglucosamine diphosphatase [Thiofilum flexile]